MNCQSVLDELKRLGTAQNRKVYRQHGVGAGMYGVSYANLGKLRKKIRVDQSLAEQLWRTGNHDARVLAAMVADPGAIKSKTLDEWVKDLDNYVVTDALSGLAGKTPFAIKKAERWVKSKNEWVGASGWSVVAAIAMSDTSLDDGYFERLLVTIEETIHNAKNRTRYAMNNAVIAIGSRNAGLEKKAVAAAKRIGKVEVDHGETGCKTPDAVAYIQKVRARRRK